MIPEAIESVFLRPRMFVAEETYDKVTTFLSGYYYALGGAKFYKEFTKWLLDEFKIRSPLGWDSYVAYVFERTHKKPFETLIEKQKLDYLHFLLEKYYMGGS